MKREYVLKNMKCAGCQAAVEKIVSNLEGVKKVEVDLGTNTLTIEAEDDFKEGTAIKMLAEAGYPVE